MPFISDLDPSLPLPTDPVGNGDDELRNLKQTLQDTFPDADKSTPIAQLKQKPINILMNGDFTIAQRGTSIALANASTYTLDRWRVDMGDGGATGTVTQGTLSDIYPTAKGRTVNYLAVDVTNASGSVTISQRVEDVRTLAGSPAGIAFDVNLTAGRSYSVDIRQNFGTGGSSNVVTSVGSGVTSGGWERLEFTVNVPNVTGAQTVGTGSFIELRIFFTDVVTNDVINLGSVQFERNEPTDFEYVDPATQLARCQRYYQKSYKASVVPGTASAFDGALGVLTNNVGTTGEIARGFSHTLPVTMRTEAPTITFYSPSTGASGSMQNVSDSVDVASTASAIADTGWGGRSGDAVGQNKSFRYHYTADADL